MKIGSQKHFQIGLTLVEMMTGVAIMGIISVGATRFFGYSSASVKMVETRTHTSTLGTNLLLRIKNDFKDILYGEYIHINSITVGSDSLSFQLDPLNGKGGGTVRYTTRCGPIPIKLRTKKNNTIPVQAHFNAISELNFCPKIIDVCGNAKDKDGYGKRPYIEMVSGRGELTTYPPGADAMNPDTVNNGSLYGAVLCAALLNPDNFGIPALAARSQDKYVLMVLTGWDPGGDKTRIQWDVQGSMIAKSVLDQTVNYEK